MIISFKHKGLVELFERGHSRRVRRDLQRRCLRRLEVLDLWRVEQCLKDELAEIRPANLTHSQG